MSVLVISNNFWLKTSEDERSKCGACVWLCGREDELGGNGGGCGGMCVSGRPGGGVGGGGRGFRLMAWGRPQPRPLDVELCDRPLSARVRVLAVDALAIAFHLGQVLVEDLA